MTARLSTRQNFARILTFLIAIAWALSATAQPVPTKLDGIGRGTLLLQEDNAEGERRVRPAPEVKTVVDITVAGPVARTRVRQLFENPGEAWAEGIYVFPLPDKAAVDGLKLRIGDRLVEGVIAERAAARRSYEQAREQGRKAALLESERPNIFTTSVANIGPGESIAVEIEYQERLRLVDGVFRLRFPMVVGPRFVPGNVRVANFNGGGWALPTDVVPDADRITPPVRHPDRGPINPISLSIMLRAGFPLAEVKSHHHAVSISEDGPDARMIMLRDGDVPADRDFELTWKPLDHAIPTAGLFYEDRADGRYVLAMLMPPTAEGTAEITAPRELIFVLDVSGSMAGTSITQAKASLARALDALSPDDRFNLIAFNNGYQTMFPDAVPATRTQRNLAQVWIRRLEAEGGTNMAPALAAALKARRTDGRLRQIVFLTDGAVGNEQALFSQIRSSLDNSRLFTVGIGSAPNRHFMRGAARAGRGTFLHIGSSEQVAPRIDELSDRLQRPALTDIAVSFAGAEAEVAPAPIPDLYAGEPVVFAARLPDGATEARIIGRRGTQDWRLVLPMSGGRESVGIAKLWARERIAQREDDRLLAEDQTAIDADILNLALEHGLVTRLTSLVAIDVTPSRPDNAPLARHMLETNLAAGWEFEKVFGQAAPQRKASLRHSPPQRASHAPQPAPPAVQADLVRLGPATGQSAATVGLPRTATPAQMHVIAGLALIAISALVFLAALNRRRLRP